MLRQLRTRLCPAGRPAAYVETSISAQGYDVTRRRATKADTSNSIQRGCVMLYVTHVYDAWNLEGNLRSTQAIDVIKIASKWYP